MQQYPALVLFIVLRQAHIPTPTDRKVDAGHMLFSLCMIKLTVNDASATRTADYSTDAPGLLNSEIRPPLMNLEVSNALTMKVRNTTLKLRK